VYCFKDEVNDPPDAPTIDGPNGGGSGIEYTYNFASCDPDNDDVYYLIDWGDGETSGWSGPYPSCQIVEISHTWSEPGTYNIIAKAKDINDAESEWSESFTVTFSNSPSAPIITGPPSGKKYTNYEFTFNSVDPDGDDVKYFIDWGDDTSEWTGFNPSGKVVKLKHLWNDEGAYNIIAKSQDIYGAESTETAKTITIPRTRASSYLIYEWLLERFPFLEKLLNLFN
jgi:hypothetical protein